MEAFGRLGALLGVSWGSLGLSWAILSEKGEMSKTKQNLMVFKGFGFPGAPKMGQVGLKMASEGVLDRLIEKMLGRCRVEVVLRRFKSRLGAFKSRLGGSKS